MKKNLFLKPFVTLFFCQFLLLTQGCILLLPFIESDQPKPADSRKAANGYGSPARYYYPGDRVPAAGRRIARSRSGEDKIQVLINQLSSNRDVVRVHAATDLGALGPRAEIALGPLAKSLAHDKSHWVRRSAAKAMGNIGSKAAIGPLTLALKDSDKYVRQSASGALRKIR